MTARRAAKATTRAKGQRRTPQEKVAEGKAEVAKQKAKRPSIAAEARKHFDAGKTVLEVSKIMEGRASYAYLWDIHFGVEARRVEQGC